MGWLKLTPAKFCKFTFTKSMYCGFSLTTTNRASIIITNATIRQHIPHWDTIVITQPQEINHFWQHIHLPYLTTPKKGARVIIRNGQLVGRPCGEISILSSFPNNCILSCAIKLEWNGLYFVLNGLWEVKGNQVPIPNLVLLQVRDL